MKKVISLLGMLLASSSPVWAQATTTTTTGTTTTTTTATTLVLACGGTYGGTTAPKVGIYDISTNPVTEKWSANYAQANDIYDSCQIVNNGTQVLVSAYRDIYLFNISDGSLAAQWASNRSHGLTLMSPGRMLVSSASSSDGGVEHVGDVQVYDYTTPQSAAIADVQMRATHTFLKVPNTQNDYYVGWQDGVSLVSIPAATAPSPTIYVGTTYSLPSTGVHDMIYDQSGNIILSTPTDVYTFNPSKQTATTYFPSPVANVKGLSLNQDSGQLMYVTAYSGDATVHQQDIQIRFNNADPITLPQEVYRAKWVYQDSNGVYSTKD